QKGDLLLKKTASVMKEACRADDIIARWGGDEFVILLPKTDEKTAAEICERFRKSCEENGILINDNKDNLPALSISFGYATKKRTDEKISDILKKAEDFMYGLKLLESRSFHISVVSSIKDTLYEKSNEPQEHTERLADFCIRTGYAMGLSETAIKDLELFCLLHDIGKIGVTESILKKEGPLDAEEWKEVKRHSELGYRIASSVPELSHIAEYILTHHERWDGNGYPRGIKKESIPLLSRILAVADAYDSMTHDKPYRKALDANEAVEELLKNTQTQFDINVVDAFINDVLGYGKNSNRLETSNCF
ncbi:MAG TPA: diguanylate cyclase, partial [Clostridia bacterium]